MYPFIYVILIVPLQAYGFNFLMENGVTTFTAGLEIKDLKIQIQYDVKDDTLENFGVLFSEKMEKLLLMPGFVSVPKDFAKIKASMENAGNYLLQVTTVGKTIRKYLNSLNIEPTFDDCIYKHTIVTQKEVNAIITYFSEEIVKTDPTWTSEKLAEDTTRISKLITVLQTTELELRFLSNEFSILLHIVDLLMSKKFPNELQGVYHDTTCVGLLTEEEHTVTSCSGYQNSLVCDIEIWYPKEKQTLPILIAVPYFGYVITGPNGEETFVKDAVSNFYQALTCYPGVGPQISHKTCKLTRLNSNCELSLSTKDISNIIEHCTWNKAKSVPPSLRLADHGVLVVDGKLKVSYKEETNTKEISGNTPFKIESKETIKVEGSGLTIRYPGNKSVLGTRITNSTIKDEFLEMLQRKIAAQAYWSILRVPSLVDYILISIQILFLVGLGVIVRQMSIAKRQLYHLRRFRNFARVTLMRRPRHPMSGPALQD